MLLFLIIGGLVVINVMGIKQAVKAINVITLIKILPVLTLIVLAIPYLTPEGVLPSNMPTFDKIQRHKVSPIPALAFYQRSAY